MPSLELVDRQNEAGEEHGAEQEQQGKLDGLALRVGDDGDDQPESQAGEDEQAQ